MPPPRLLSFGTTSVQSVADKQSSIHGNWQNQEPFNARCLIVVQRPANMPRIGSLCGCYTVSSAPETFATIAIAGLEKVVLGEVRNIAMTPTTCTRLTHYVVPQVTVRDPTTLPFSTLPETSMCVVEADCGCNIGWHICMILGRLSGRS